MALSDTRYQGTNLWGNTGWSRISAAGPFVLVGARNSTWTGFWLFRRESGVLVEKLNPYSPTLYPPSWGLAYWGRDQDCWYDEATQTLRIIVSAIHDSWNGSFSGSIYFLEWPLEGTQNSDMVELGRIDGEWAGQRIGKSVAICNNWAMAQGDTDQITFFSKTGGTWSQDKRATYTGCSGAYGLRLWAHPDTDGVLGVVGQRNYNGTNGRITVVKSVAPGTWTDEATLDGGSLEHLGEDCDIGLGLGTGTIASTSYTVNERGIHVYDRIADDNWADRGRVQDVSGGSCCEGRSVSVGYQAIAFGFEQYTIDTKTNAGGFNVAQMKGNGTWPIGEIAQYFEYPSDVQQNEYHTDDRGLRLVYQEGGYVRFVGSSWGYNSQEGSIVEFVGELDFPFLPSDFAVRTKLGANYVDGVRYEDPTGCVGAINQIPANGETDVDAATGIKLHLVSYLNAAIE
jgi:hypothetical protein